MRLPQCPTPPKLRYSSIRQAEAGARRTHQRSIAEGEEPQPVYGYLCLCGFIHLTRKAHHKGKAGWGPLG